METNNKRYDCAIIGGGLAGLCLSIQLANNGISVVVFEKNEYPFHKVCGEYISMESWDFLSALGLPLEQMQLPKINFLGVSSENGFMLNAPLDMGGFGISRYTLDNELYKLAVSKKVTIIQNCKVYSVSKTENSYDIETSQGVFGSTILCGSYGKYAPSFIQNNENYHSKKDTGSNYIGVKYHIKSTLSDNRIELHNFKGGYCGVSKVDQDWYCLCYLSDSKNLSENGNNIKQMEEMVLHKNPFLKKYFTESEFLNAQPIVISNIQFSKKQTNIDGIFLLGDAAGSITPLCGNGMSMGMKASKILATELILFFERKIALSQLIINYENSWNKSFNARIKTGYYLQNLFGKKRTTHVVLKLLNKLPGLTNKIISLTHGEKF